MENKKLDKILPLLDLAKYLGRGSAVVISEIGNNKESYNAKGKNLSQKDKDLLEPFVTKALNSPKNITIIPNVQKVDGLDPGKWSQGNFAILGYVGCPLLSSKGNSLGVLSIIFDTVFQFNSDQEKALLTVASQVSKELEERPEQRELELQKEINKNIIENSKLSLWTCNLEENQLYFDDKAAELVGYEAQELSPMTLKDWEAMIHPEDLEMMREKWKGYLAGAFDTYEVSYRIAHKDGSWKWFLECGNTVTRSNQGVPLKMVGTIEDITQQKLDYLHLEDALQRLTYLSRATTDAIWDLDLVNETLL
ncbi:MAG: PAS domain-containing protein, partial [Flavobacteriales bacterium]